MPESLYVNIARMAARAVADTIDTSDELGQHHTGISCVIPNCSGIIILERSLKYVGDPGHMIVGPAGRNQMTTVEKLYCHCCGISYHHLPRAPETNTGEQG